MKLHIVLNCYAGSGRGEKLWQQWKNDIRVEYTLHITKRRGHAIAIARAIAQQAAQRREPTCIAAIGGDGTIHEVINGALYSEWVMVGVIAGGSANDYKRSYPTFEHVEQLHLFLQNPTKKKHDCGMIHWQEKRAFMNNFGVGFDAAVTEMANNSSLKKRLGKIGLGKLSYVYFLVKHVFAFRPFNLTIHCHNKRYDFQRVWFATVCNQPYFGGGMKLSPLSKTDDGMLEVIVIHSFSAFKIMLLFMSVFFGQHVRFQGVTQLKGQHITFTHENLQYCHADGEVLGKIKGSLQIEIAPLSWNATIIRNEEEK